MNEPPNSNNFSIKSWAEDDRPREKLIKKGRLALSNAELIAILIGSGGPNVSAVDLSKKILSAANNDLHRLSLFSLADLLNFKGIGIAKAVTIVAALEIGRRRRETKVEKALCITSSKDAYHVLYEKLTDLDHEQFYAILLKQNNEVIDVIQISKGGVAGTIVDPRLIFKPAIEKLASAIIVAHNHPSGNLKPSQADEKITNQLLSAGKLLNISILDHLIIASQSYFSFADEGKLKG